jgi:hypothetical protein
VVSGHYRIGRRIFRPSAPIDTGGSQLLVRMKKIGAMVMLTADAGTEGYGLALFTRVLDMSVEESMAICKGASVDIKNKNYHVSGCSSLALRTPADV